MQTAGLESIFQTLVFQHFPLASCALHSYFIFSKCLSKGHCLIYIFTYYWFLSCCILITKYEIKKWQYSAITYELILVGRYVGLIFPQQIEPYNNYINALSLHHKSHFSPDRLAIAHRFIVLFLNNFLWSFCLTSLCNCQTESNHCQTRGHCHMLLD